MTLKERNIWHLPLLILALWLGGCSSHLDEDEPDYPLNVSGLNLVLNISSVDRGLGMTRAGDEAIIDPDKRMFESAKYDTERINSLRVIIVEKNSHKVVYNDPITSMSPTDRKEGLKYAVDYSTTYVVYIIANEEGLPAESKSIFENLKSGDIYSESDMETAEISVATAGYPYITDSDTPVPMTEKYVITTKSEEDAKEETVDGGAFQSETFFITRAASKFSFYFFRKGISIGDSDKRVIEQVKIDGLGKSEYLFPNQTTYVPDKETDRVSSNRDITEFAIPTIGNLTGNYEFTLPNGGLKVTELPERSESFDPKNPTLGLLGFDERKYVYTPTFYFPESKGDSEGKFYCTIKYAGDDETYKIPVSLDNLPYALPRNTHVVVIITISDIGIEATVDVIPFTSVLLNPDYGLGREQLTGYVIGKDAEGRKCWYDRNYYQSGTGYPGPTDAKPLYLGPATKEGRPGNPGEPVTIDGKEYMLVYSDYDRTAENLDHFFEVFIVKSGNTFVTDENGRYTVTDTPVKHLLTMEGITGFEPRTASDGMDFWISDMKQRVGLENNKVLSQALMFIDRTEAAKDNAGNYPEYQVYYKDYDLSFAHTVNVWDYTEYKNVFGDDHIPGYYPKYWFDVFGKKYDMIAGPAIEEYPAYPKFPEHPGDAPEKPEGEKPSRPVKPTPPTVTVPSYPLVSDFITLPDGFDTWTDAKKNEWYTANWWGTEKEKQYIEAQKKYEKDLAEYNKQSSEYQTALEQYNKDLAAYDEYIKAMAKWNNYQAALDKYNKAVEDFPDAVAKWNSDVDVWKTKVKDEWNPKLEEWLTKVNQDKETKLGEWVKYLKD